MIPGKIGRSLVSLVVLALCACGPSPPPVPAADMGGDLPPGTLTALAVRPPGPTLARGATVQFTASGTFSDGSTRDVTAQATWTSQTMTVATISAHGLATGVGPGTSLITASVSGHVASTPLTVTGAALTAVAVTPPFPMLTRGATQQFTATGTFSDHTTGDITSQVTWKSSDAGVASISNQPGSQGLATAAGSGVAEITASLAGLSDTARVGVSPSLTGLSVAPAMPSIANGTTVQLTATGSYDDHTTRDLSAAVTWSVTDATVASVSNDKATPGLATALKAGSTTITAKLGTFTAQASLRVTSAVLQSLAIDPPMPMVDLGDTLQLAATGTFDDGTSQDITPIVTWASTNTKYATVSNDPGMWGVVTGATVGTVTISASHGALHDSVLLTIF